MVVRLLSFSVIRSLRSNLLRYLSQPKLAKTCYEFNVIQTARSLHVKVLDKDADWEAQRVTNKYVKNSENLNNFHSNETLTEAVTLNRKDKENYKAIPVEAKDGFIANEDADVFGNANLNEKDDEGDVVEDEYLSNPPSKSQRLNHIQYVRLIKQHLKAKQLKEAIEVVEKRMKSDRVKPETYTFNLLISACGKAGYTRKAFSLFTRMRQRGLAASGGTYTSLFNACANAPTAADGLVRANHVREIMLEKGVEPNVMNYNAMIKAYGRWGDVKTAYQLVDEMREKKLKLTAETYNFLLQACASDKGFGFRHCLLTWHKMIQDGFKPDYFSFNTVLRCVRDCEFGDLETMQKALKEILKDTTRLGNNISANQDGTMLLINGENSTIAQADTKLIESPLKRTTNPFGKSDTKNLVNSTQLTNADMRTEGELAIPNLLSVQPHLGSMMALSEVVKPHERFLLLGGINGFLDLMKQYNLTPNIQLFTMMLEVIPPTNAAEKQILTYIRRIGLKADIDFFNVLIKKRSMRFDYEGAKEVLTMIRTAGLEYDIVTYGVLALGCRTQEEARELLQQMRQSNIRMNIQILGAMLRQGCTQYAFPYVCEIMQISLDEHIKPNDVFLRHLHNFYRGCARAIDARHPSTRTKEYKKKHGKFCDKLRLFYEEHDIAGLKLEDAIRVVQGRPYQQYKENMVDGLEPVKNEKLAQKQKIRKYIKKIKIDNLRGDESNSEANHSKALNESHQKALNP